MFVECIKERLARLKYVFSQKLLENILTKAVIKVPFIIFRAKLCAYKNSTCTSLEAFQNVRRMHVTFTNNQEVQRFQIQEITIVTGHGVRTLTQNGIASHPIWIPKEH